MRRLILILATVALLAVGSAAPAAAFPPGSFVPPGTQKGDGKPNAAWLVAVLDGNASDRAKAAVTANH